MADPKKKSFFERLTGSMRVNEDEVFDDTKIDTTFQKETEQPRTLKVSQDADPFLHTYEEEEDGELPLDVYQTDSEIIVQAFVAGVRPDELQITITRDTLTIKGKRQESQNIDEDGYSLRELYWGSFSRVVTLPAEVEPEEAEAVEKHGLIIIKLPKIDRQKRASVKIKSI